MKSFRDLLIIFIFFSSFSALNAQEISVKIKVTDPYTNDPIEGAVITALNNCSGSSCSFKTNAEGEAFLTITKLHGDVLVWSPGFYQKIVTLSDTSLLTVVLIPENKLGYNNKAYLPNKEIIDEENKQTNIYSLEKKNVVLSKSFADQSFEGVAGLQVIEKSGMPGEGSYFTLRGISTIVGNSSPLIVINGVPYFPDQNESPIIGGYSKNILNSLNPSNIENITFLKGSDASLYGSLGSNGVILIETDKATDMETKIEFTGKYGIAYNQHRMPLLNISEYKSYIGDIAKTKYPDMGDVLSNFPYLVDNEDYYYKYLYNNNTDWQDIIYRPAFTTDNVLKVKGGDEIAKYNLSVGYLNQNGQVRNTDYTRYNVRLNADINLHKKISMFADLAVVHSQNEVKEQGMYYETNSVLTAFRKAPIFSPYEKDADNNESPDYAKIYDSNGNIILNNSVSNPLAVVNSINADSKINDVLLSGGLNFKLNQNLKIVGLVGLNYNFNRENLFIPGITLGTIMPLQNNMAKNTVHSGVGETFNMYYNLNGSYNFKINNVHEFKTFLGFQAVTTDQEYDAGQGMNTSSDFYKTLNYVSTSGRSFYGYNDIWNWMNFYTSVKYIFNKQYALGINASYDGSSATGTNAQRFDLFPSMNVAWFAKNSKFLRNISLINKLNLRAEYFMTGNSRFSSMLSKYYYTTSPYRVLSGLVLASVPNTELTSEKTKTFDAGMDVSVLNYRINLTFDYYLSKVDNLILPQNVSSAFGNEYFYENIGSMENSGFEVSLQASLIQTKNIEWLIGGTITKNINRINTPGGESIIREMKDGSALIIENGKPAYSFYGYKSVGVFSNGADALSANLQNHAGNTFQAGDIHFVDSDTNHIINENDRFNIGNPNPDFFGNLYSSFRFKRFELSANFKYSIGNHAYNAVRREMESQKDFGNQYISITGRWKYEGQVTDIPKVAYNDPLGNSRFSDRWIEDASYIKLKEITASYKFNYFKGVTVFISGENLFTITNYLGLDPESMYSYNPTLSGYDYAKVALARTFKLGFKIQF